jgi:hypothetical protein
LLPFFEHYNWGCECCTSVIMTLGPTHTLIHDFTTKYPKPAELMKWLVIQIAGQTHFQFATFSPQNTPPSHDHLRRVSKSPLLHLFTCRRSGT